MEGPECSGVVALDVAHMKEGDVAGFSAFNGDAALLSVIVRNGKKYLTMSVDSVSLDSSNKAVLDVKSEEKEQLELNQSVVYLRIDGNFRLNHDIASCYYSLDNKNWKKIGEDFKMKFDYRRLFIGTRFAIFNYATNSLGGYVDVDYLIIRKLNNCSKFCM